MADGSGDGQVIVHAARHGTGIPSAASHHRALAACFVLVAGSVIVWIALAFVPGVSQRIGVPPVTASAAEGRAGALTYGLIVLGALAIAAAMRQPIVPGSRARWLTATALPAGAIGLTAALALSWAAGLTTIAAAPAGGAAGLLLGWLLVGWAALGEEVMFRGVIQPVLVRAWGPMAALGAGALAFTFVHYLGGWRDPLSLLNIFAASIWFGLLALRTGGILAPWLTHLGWNGVEALLFGASPNPGVGAYGSLIDVDLAGPAMLGGSADGLNASLGTTLVLAALISPLAWRARRDLGTGR